MTIGGPRDPDGIVASTGGRDTKTRAYRRISSWWWCGRFSRLAQEVREVTTAYQGLVLQGPPHLPWYYGRLERQNREHRPSVTSHRGQARRWH